MTNLPTVALLVLSAIAVAAALAIIDARLAGWWPW